MSPSKHTRTLSHEPLRDLYLSAFFSLIFSIGCVLLMREQACVAYSSLVARRAKCSRLCLDHCHPVHAVNGKGETNTLSYLFLILGDHLFLLSEVFATFGGLYGSPRITPFIGDWPRDSTELCAVPKCLQLHCSEEKRMERKRFLSSVSSVHMLYA
jgi:hypothetical protein